MPDPDEQEACNICGRVECICDDEFDAYKDSLIERVTQ